MRIRRDEYFCKKVFIYFFISLVYEYYGVLICNLNKYSLCMKLKKKTKNIVYVKYGYSDKKTY